MLMRHSADHVRPRLSQRGPPILGRVTRVASPLTEFASCRVCAGLASRRLARQRPQSGILVAIPMLRVKNCLT